MHALVRATASTATGITHKRISHKRMPLVHEQMHATAAIAPYITKFTGLGMRQDS
jgi:hypothetical protein